MSRKFTITTPTNLARADAEGRVQVQFTVTNTSGAPERRLFRAAPLGDAKESWLSLAGESERAFAADGVHQLSVGALVPPGTAAGRYGFRLDSIAATRAGEEIEEGPAIYFDYAGSEPVKKSKAWIWIAAAIVLLVVGGAVAWLVTGRTDEKQPVAPVAQVEQVDVADVATSHLYIAEAMRKLQEAGFTTKLKFEQSEDAKPGSVTAQSPAPNTRATRGSPVELTVASAEEESFDLPNADEQNLSAGTVNALHDFFLQQRRVDVPNMSGPQMQAVGAIRALQIYGLRAILRPEPNTASPPGNVVAQKPDPNTEVRVGTPVTLFVAVNRDADLTLSPEEQAHIGANAESRLSTLFRDMAQPPAGAPMAFVVMTPRPAPMLATPIIATPIIATPVATTTRPPQP
jgi:hypothetical protein